MMTVAELVEYLGHFVGDVRVAKRSGDGQIVDVSRDDFVYLGDEQTNGTLVLPSIHSQQVGKSDVPAGSNRSTIETPPINVLPNKDDPTIVVWGTPVPKANLP